MATLLLVASEGVHGTSRNLLEEYMLDCLYSTFAQKSHIYTDLPTTPPLPLWSSFPNLSKVYLLDCSPPFCPEIETRNSHVVPFFF